jgi:hypothetical protein
LFFLFFLFSKAQNKIILGSDTCTENIFGKWQMYKREYPYGALPIGSNVVIWNFDKEGKILINEELTSYKINEDCSILETEENVKFYMTLTKDSLYLRNQFLPHECSKFYFKKLK